MSDIDVYLTKTQLEDLFYDVSTAILGISPLFDVRHSWPQGGAPAFDIDKEVCFLKIFDVPSPVTQQREQKFSQIGSPNISNMKTVYTRTLQVNWMFYGQESWQNATDVMNNLYKQEYREILTLQNVFMVPDFEPPKRVPELWEGLWYQRADLFIKFNEKIELNVEVPAIEIAEIIIEDRNGIEAIIEINDN